MNYEGNSCDWPKNTKGECVSLCHGGGTVGVGGLVALNPRANSLITTMGVTMLPWIVLP
jgi:hypothetical protein